MITEMQIKTTMRYHLTPVRMVFINKQQTTIGKDVEKEEPFGSAAGNADWCSHSAKEYGINSKRLKVGLPYDPVIPLLETDPKKPETPVLKNIRPSVHRSVVYDRQDVEAARVSMTGWLFCLV